MQNCRQPCIALAAVSVSSPLSLLHGFSIGGAAAAIYLSSPHAPVLPFVSDRSLRSLPHTAFGIVRQPRLRAGGEAEAARGAKLPGRGSGVAAWKAWLWLHFEAWGRAFAGGVAVGALRL